MRQESIATFAEFILAYSNSGGSILRGDIIFEAQYGHLRAVRTFDDLYRHIKRRNRDKGDWSLARDMQEAARLWIEYDKEISRTFYPEGVSPEEFYGLALKNG
jgi:hypothetical protein